MCLVRVSTGLKQADLFASPVMDPRFPRGGRQLERGAPTYDLATNLQKNSMKMKKKWTGGEGVPVYNVDPPADDNHCQ